MKHARRDLCGGYSVMVIPTAIGINDRTRYLKYVVASRCAYLILILTPILNTIVTFQYNLHKFQGVLLLFTIIFHALLLSGNVQTNRECDRLFL